MISSNWVIELNARNGTTWSQHVDEAALPSINKKAKLDDFPHIDHKHYCSSTSTESGRVKIIFK